MYMYKYKKKQTNATKDLLTKITHLASKRGLALSRWPELPHRSKRITWMLHSGDRCESALRQDGYVCAVRLTQIEGKTKNCEAYRLLNMLMLRNFTQEEIEKY